MITMYTMQSAHTCIWHLWGTCALSSTIVPSAKEFPLWPVLLGASTPRDALWRVRSHTGVQHGTCGMGTRDAMASAFADQTQAKP